jgi:hypothetical protein
MPSLITGQHQQLSIDGKQLGDCVLESASGVHGWADRVAPLSGNGLDALLPIDHEGKGVERMAAPIGAMAAWFAATPLGACERPWESVGRNPEAGHKASLAALQRSGLRPERGLRLIHLIVIIQSEHWQKQYPLPMSSSAPKLWIKPPFVQ